MQYSSMAFIKNEIKNLVVLKFHLITRKLLEPIKTQKL